MCSSFYSPRKNIDTIGSVSQQEDNLSGDKVKIGRKRNALAGKNLTFVCFDFSFL